MISTRLRLGAALGVLALALSGRSSAESEAQADTAASSTIKVEDNNGTQTVTTPPTSVVATDNRTFETLDAWGIKLSAGARGPHAAGTLLHERRIDPRPRHPP